MNILLSGSTGFLGTKVLDLLKNTSHTLLILNHTQKPNQTDLPKNIIVKSGSITDKESLLQIKNSSVNTDAIIHLAAFVPKNPTQDQEKQMHDVNVLGTQNLLEVFGDTLQSFIYASTAEVYGLPDTGKLIDEDTVPNPISFYAKSKLVGEKIVEEFSQNRKVPAAILRFSVMYGPGDTIERAIPNFIKTAIANREIKVFGGEELRDYLHRNDAAKAVVNALDKKADGIFVIASGKGISIKDAAEIIVKKANSESVITIEPRRKKRSDLIMDITKAKKYLGFTPDYFFPDEIDEAIQWMKRKRI